MGEDQDSELEPKALADGVDSSRDEASPAREVQQQVVRENGSPSQESTSSRIASS